MKIAYLDCFSGISGNMILGAMMDLGLPKTKLEEELDKLSLSGYEITCSTEARMEINGSRVKVILKETDSHHRSFSDIKNLINGSSLDKDTKELSIRVFQRLAEAEAKIHKKDIDDIHFHEVGAVDSIVDVVGAAVGIKHFGIQEIYASRIPLGSGFVTCQHGALPLPAPATMELLKGKPVYESGIMGELVTPTGAAIITTLTDKFGRMPSMIISDIGYGVGDKEFQEVPNLLRVVLGDDERERETDRVTVVETNIDDMNPEVYDFLMERLFEEGALDVSLSPLQMKKNRPSVMLRVICHGGDKSRVIDTILKESTSFGVRYYEVDRVKVPRRLKEVETRFGKVKVKIYQDNDAVINVSPEYEDCKKIAKEKKVPLKRVYNEAVKEVLSSSKN
ncbi:MAG: nickel pincer cofactor biosynthesis protein LarC [Thermodesulfobacteriota bacterium]